MRFGLAAVLAVSTVLALGCGRLGFSSTQQDAATADALPLGVFAEPQVVEELESAFRDADPALTADMLLIYFNSERPGGLGESDLWFASRPSVDERWSPPEPATELNSDNIDEGAHLSNDGLTIYFSSRRPGVDNTSILVARRDSRAAPFDAPILLTDVIDTAAGEFSPSLTADEATLYYATDTFEGVSRLTTVRTTLAAGVWSTPMAPPDLNPVPGGAPAVFNDGDSIVLSQRSDDGAHLVEFGRDSGSPFSVVRQLTELTGSGNEVGSWLSNDGEAIYFDRNEVSGERSIFTTRRSL